MKKHEYQNLYNRNPETKSMMIEVSLEDYSEIFNGWDASPIRRKDLEPELIDYLEQSGTEIPLDESVEICFYLPPTQKDLEKEQKSIVAIKNNFRVVVFFINKRLKRGYRQMATFIVLSLLFITSAYIIRGQEPLPLLTSIMREGLFIGGWVFLWEAFNLFFFTTHEERKRRKIFYRYLDSEIIFKDMKDI
ncbi:MAG: hypothetical protein RBT45_00475 [Acholeplasmataceae bacterium]|jgi:hypothetical protein|nr:hypothetical protein [Acholeplasmataceae bacterium]